MKTKNTQKIYNKTKALKPCHRVLSNEERLRILANMLIDKIFDDQNKSKLMFKNS